MNSSALKILVIEDNPGDFALVEDFLNDQIKAATIKHAPNFKSAMAELTKPDADFDIVLLDITLPDNAGEPLIEAIVKACPNAPVIVLTGYADFAFSVRSLSLGVADYLLKDELTSLSLYKSIIYSSERRRQSDELAASQLKYSELFQLSPLPMWVFEVATLRFLDVNDAAVEHYGYSREEFLAMTILDIRPVTEIHAIDDIINKPHNVNRFIKQGIFLHQKKNGDLIQVEIQSNTVDYKGKAAKIILANDITERLNYISEIETQNKTLKEISWMQSHVIRAPLTRIMGLVALIQDLKEKMVDFPVAMAQMFEYLMISAQELDEVIKDITDKTRTGHNKE
nr:response regulator [uncultured Mucilaginibacter sp.]